MVTTDNKWMICTDCLPDPDGNCIVLCPLHAATKDLLESLENLVICPTFNGKQFEKDKESHRAWTLARYFLDQLRDYRGRGGENDK